MRDSRIANTALSGLMVSEKASSAFRVSLQNVELVHTALNDTDCERHATRLLFSARSAGRGRASGHSINAVSPTSAEVATALTAPLPWQTRAGSTPHGGQTPPSSSRTTRHQPSATRAASSSTMSPWSSGLAINVAGSARTSTRAQRLRMCGAV